MSDEINHVTPDDESPVAVDETSSVAAVDIAPEPETEVEPATEPVAAAPTPAPAMTTPAPSFWKPIHGIIGVVLILGIVLLTRGCGSEDAQLNEVDAKQSAKVETQVTPVAPVQPVVIQVPVPVPANQWPQRNTSQPSASASGNKWVVPGNQNAQPRTVPEWGKSYQSGPLYTQPRPDSDFRPLARTQKPAPSSRSTAPVPSWSIPYDRPDGSSFGNTENRPVNPGAYPGYPNTGYPNRGYPNAGYPGASPYGYPGAYGGGYPGGYGSGFPFNPGAGIPNWY